MRIYSIGDVAAWITKVSGEYVGPQRISDTIKRLVQSGALVERRAGRQRVVIESDLPVIESELGVTESMVNAIQHTDDALGGARVTDGLPKHTRDE